MSNKKKVFLRILNISDKEKFLEANNAEWGSFPFAHYWESLAGKDFVKYIDILSGIPKGENLPEGHVPCTFLFAFNEEGDLIGRTSIRHELTEHLMKVGGHIEYGVVPKFRKKGYATAILEASLDYIKNYLPELNKVLVTCDEDNEGSRKTIVRNGGELENILEIAGSARKMRFWISITH